MAGTRRDMHAMLVSMCMCGPVRLYAVVSTAYSCILGEATCVIGRFKDAFLFYSWCVIQCDCTLPQNIVYLLFW